MGFRRLLQFSSSPSIWAFNFCLFYWFFLSYGLFSWDLNGKLAVLILWAFFPWFLCFGLGFFTCRRKYVKLISSHMAPFKSLQPSWNKVMDCGKKKTWTLSLLWRIWELFFSSKKNSFSLALLRLLLPFRIYIRQQSHVNTCLTEVVMKVKLVFPPRT